MHRPGKDELETAELLGWAEFSCWTALLLTPVIWYLQGQSVSQGQFIVRTALVVLAAVGALTLRTVALVGRFRSGVAPSAPSQVASGNRTAEVQRVPEETNS